MLSIQVIALLPSHYPIKWSNVTIVWYVYWISFEAAIAIIMVSITGFRGIFGSSDSTRGSSGRRMPSYFAEKLSSVSSRMGHFFIWSSESSASATQISDASSDSVNRKEKKNAKEIHHSGFFFRWATHTVDDNSERANSDADEITSVTQLRPVSRSASRDVERSVDTTGISMQSKMSTLSTRNYDVSPLSSGVGIGGARKSSCSDIDERTIELPITRHSPTASELAAPPSPNGLGSWAVAARKAAQADYEDRARAWGRSGQLSPDVRDIEKGFS